jgi:hypothetical protein
MNRRPPFFWRIEWLLVLLFMMLIDIGPFPFTATICLYILLFRPRWFKKWVDRLYPPE